LHSIKYIDCLSNTCASSFTPAAPIRKLLIYKSFFNLNDEQKGRVIYHEIGHILGFRHETAYNESLISTQITNTNYDSIMHDKNKDILIPTGNDIQTLKNLYNGHYKIDGKTKRLKHIVKVYENDKIQTLDDEYKDFGGYYIAHFSTHCWVIENNNKFDDTKHWCSWIFKLIEIKQINYNSFTLFLNITFTILHRLIIYLTYK